MQSELVQSIEGVYHKKDLSEVRYERIVPVLTTTMYTSTKTPIWRLRIDDVETTRNTPYVVKYVCINCASTHTVSMVSFLRKLNSRNPAMCYTCRNLDETKRNEHSKWMTGKDIRKYHPNTCCKVTIEEIHQQAVNAFDTLSELERSNYYKTHLSQKQMAKVLPHVLSLHNGNITSERLRRSQYWDIYPTNNQMRFSPVFYDPECNEIIRILQPVMKCEQCDVPWRCKNMKPFVSSERILCPTCKLCRRTFKIRNTLNQNGDKVMYQSKPELAFIEWCRQHNILVVNGPNVPYVFQDKVRTYRVDFYLPDIQYLVEVKDDHCWHKSQVESGQWDCKVNAVAHCIQQGYYNKYLLLTPKTKKNCLQEILARISKI